MNTVYVGVDISKKSLDVAVCASEHEAEFFKQIDNQVEDINRLIRQLHKEYSSDELWFCFEHTGNYGLLLASCLETEAVSYSRVPAMQIKKSLGMVRGKNDQVDAIRIAEYASVHAHKLSESKLPTEELSKIKALLSHRKLLVKMRTKLKNSLQAHQLVEEQLEEAFLSDSINERIESLSEEINSIERQIKTITKDCDQLADNYHYATSVTGIGLITGASMLVYTSNFTSFDLNPRKFNCYAGLAPFEHRSGSSINGQTRTSNYRQKVIKTLLHNGVNSAIINDPQLKKYYHRKLDEGKDPTLVKNNVACKLVSRVFAVVRDQREYVVFDY